MHGLFTRRWEAVVVNEPVHDRRLPSPTQPAGTDLLPQIEHIVVLMKENHTFDNYFGMLGRGTGSPSTSTGNRSTAIPTRRAGR